MLVIEAVEEYSYAILRHAPRTQTWYLSTLKVFVEWCVQEKLILEEIKQTDIRRFIESIRKRTNPRTGKPVTSFTVHGYARSVKCFLSWCSKEDGIDTLVSERLPRRMEMPKLQSKVIETSSTDQVKAMLQAAEKEYNQTLTVRDRSIIYVLFDTGIRASELCSLTLDNVYLRADDAYIKVLGKGDKWREVGLGKTARTALHRYLTRYRKASATEQHVFLNRYKLPLTVSGLEQIIYRLGEWAKVKGVRCSPHTFRHTFAVNYLKATGDIYKLSRIMGHSGVEVTGGKATLRL